MHLCITGLRSVGKTTLALSMAQNRGMSFHDTDGIADRHLAAHGTSFIREMKHQRYTEVYEAILAGLSSVLGNTDSSVISAAWGCFQHTELAQLLRDQTFIVGLIPATDPAQAAAILYPRERSRTHFDYLNDDDLMELCKRDATHGIDLLARYCHAWLLVGHNGPESVWEQLRSILWR